MVCLANQRSQGETAVWAAHWHSQQPLRSPRLCQAICSGEADLVFRCPHGLSSRALSLSVCPTDRPTGPGPVEEIQSSEEALIHHTSLAACHLNAKYFHCIFKSKQEKK